MMLGLQFRNGMRLGLDLGPDVTARSIAAGVGGAIRSVGARAATQIRKASDRAAARAMQRIEARKAKSK
jgi:hypothetical protein